MDDLIVIDDFIPKQLQERLDFLLHSESFNWVYSKNTAHNLKSFDDYVKNFSGVYPSVRDDGQMVSNIFHQNAPEELMQAKWLDMFTSLIWFMFDRVPEVTISEYDRVKANMNLKKSEEWEHKIATPHIDSKFLNRKSLLYYVNSSDGDTIIYNERYADTLDNIPLTQRQRVTPKRGRAILFDSDIVHSHMYNTEADTRAIINFCFLQETTEPENDLQEIEV